jgi:uncharacterized protein (DUF488 family)
MRICTIGFTRKSAEEFFCRLRKSGVKRVVDVRLNNVSQLAGFSKKGDLEFFLRAILGIEYVHLPILAPTPQILDEFKKSKGDWRAYEARFIELMRSRQVENRLSRKVLDQSCLLCSEDKPSRCHRRLVVEYLANAWGNVRVEHL